MVYCYSCLFLFLHQVAFWFPVLHLSFHIVYPAFFSFFPSLIIWLAISLCLYLSLFLCLVWHMVCCFLGTGATPCDYIPQLPASHVDSLNSSPPPPHLALGGGDSWAGGAKTSGNLSLIPIYADDHAQSSHTRESAPYVRTQHPTWNAINYIRISRGRRGIMVGATL